MHVLYLAILISFAKLSSAHVTGAFLCSTLLKFISQLNVNLKERHGNVKVWTLHRL